jgi:hypothetical protein
VEKGVNIVMTSFGNYVCKVLDEEDGRLVVADPVQMVVNLQTGAVILADTGLRELVIVGSYGYGRAPEDIVQKYFEILSGDSGRVLTGLM